MVADLLFGKLIAYIRFDILIANTQTHKLFAHNQTDIYSDRQTDSMFDKKSDTRIAYNLLFDKHSEDIHSHRLSDTQSDMQTEDNLSDTDSAHTQSDRHSEDIPTHKLFDNHLVDKYFAYTPASDKNSVRIRPDRLIVHNQFDILIVNNQIHKPFDMKFDMWIGNTQFDIPGMILDTRIPSV